MLYLSLTLSLPLLPRNTLDLTLSFSLLLSLSFSFYVLLSQVILLSLCLYIIFLCVKKIYNNLMKYIW